MTKYDDAWVARMEAEFARLEAEGLYHPEQEHASCGVGLVVAIDGKAAAGRHGGDRCLESRLASRRGRRRRQDRRRRRHPRRDAGQVLQHHIDRAGHRPKKDSLLAVGQVFLPRTNMADQETCRTIVETEILASATASMAGGRCQWTLR